mmetsp:Transcript_8517/g.17239  ORF Transcript_8517/g.17239 Transcript_8517/m.17239 type:complete len:200 (-) Transcript_8517:1551-2150(-)
MEALVLSEVVEASLRLLTSAAPSFVGSAEDASNDVDGLRVPDSPPKSILFSDSDGFSKPMSSSRTSKKSERFDTLFSSLCWLSYLEERSAKLDILTSPCSSCEASTILKMSDVMAVFLSCKISCPQCNHCTLIILSSTTCSGGSKRSRGEGRTANSSSVCSKTSMLVGAMKLSLEAWTIKRGTVMRSKLGVVSTPDCIP